MVLQIRLSDKKQWQILYKIKILIFAQIKCTVFCFTTKLYVIYNLNSSLLFDQFISNIQEIVDIELIFELIYMFFFVFLSSFQMIRKQETNNKIGESTKLLLYYNTIVVKHM